jgi:hypothetical protein
MLSGFLNVDSVVYYRSGRRGSVPTADSVSMSQQLVESVL